MLQLKTMYEMNILKLKDFIMLQNILFVKDCLSENVQGRFNDKFHGSKLPLNHTTRSSSTHQLKVNNFLRLIWQQINSEQMHIRLEQPPNNITTKLLAK